MPVPRGPQVLVVALVGATLTSSIALYDAGHHGLTGQSSMFSDDYGRTAIMLVGGAVHGLTYLALGWVLLAAADWIDLGSRIRRWLRRGLVAVFAALAGVFLVGVPFQREDAPAEAILGPVAGVAFLAMFVLAFALGVALIRHREQRPAALLLVGIVPAIGLAIALASVGSGFAHPGYAETLVHFGIALLALPQARPAASGIDPVPRGRVEATPA